MSDATTKVGIVFTATDGSAAGLRSVEQAVKKAADVAVEGSSKTALAAKDAALKSTQAVQAAHDTHVRLYRDMANARETLGIRAERTVRQEIQQTQAAYQTLARSGALSARELARAQDATLAKVRELKRELGEVSKLERFLSPGALMGLTAAAMQMKPAVSRAMGYDYSVAQITNTQFSDRDAAGRIAGKAEVKRAISEALKFGGDRDQVAGTLSELLSSGEFSKDAAYAHLKTVTKGSTATGADPKQLSGIVLAAKRMGIGDDQMEAVISKATRAGQLGGFELSDMSKHLPAAMASARALGLSGMSGFERVLTSMQASVATAGTKDEAAINLINILEKVNSEDTAKDFDKQGINLRKELAAGAMRGEDTLTTFTGLIDGVIAKDPKLKAVAAEADRLSKASGDKSNPDRQEALRQVKAIYESSVVGKFLQDRQALQGFRAEKEGSSGADPLVSRVRSGLQADNGQELEASYAVMNDTAKVQQQRLANANAEGQDKALTGAGGVAKPFYQGLVSTAEDNPLLTAGLSAAGTGLGLFAAGAGLNSLLGWKGASRLPGVAAGLASKVATVPKAGLAGIGASVGGALLSDLYGEESTAARYGSAALSGAGMGATLGSIVPILGTGVGAAGGAALGMALQGISDLLKKDPKPTNVKADIKVGLAPGLVLQGQTVQTTGPAGVAVNTGNIWNGAPQ